MRREFLKNLGIEDKDIIDRIIDENSADIGKAKGELSTVQARVTELEGQLAARESEVADLNKKVGDVDALNQRITQLETDKENLTTELSTKVSQIQKTHAIESGVRDAKAKNVKAVMALLDLEKITHENGELTGLSEQLEALQKSDAFLFGETTISGTSPSNPHSNGGNAPTYTSFADAIAKAVNSNK